MYEKQSKNQVCSTQQLKNPDYLIENAIHVIRIDFQFLITTILYIKSILKFITLSD